MKDRLLKIATGLGLAAVVAMIAFDVQDRHRLKADVARIRSETNARTERERPGTNTYVFTSASRVAANAEVQPDNDPATASAVPEEAVEFTVEERGARLEAAFDADQVDVPWARETKPKVEADLAQLTGTTSNVRSIDCRSTWCRAEMTHRDWAAYMEFQGRIRAQASPFWRGEMFYRVVSAETEVPVRTEMFLVREGVEADIDPK